MMKRLIAIVLLGLLAGCYDVMTSRSSDMKGEQAMAARTGGWIPSFAPLDAVKVVERHDLDTNKGVVSFELVSPDWWEWVAKHGSRVEYDDIQSKLPSPAFLPRDVRGEFQKAIKASPSFFRVPDESRGTLWYVMKAEDSSMVFLFDAPPER